MVLEGIGNGNIIYGFANTIETIIVVVGVFGYGFVLGMLYNFVLVFGVCLEYMKHKNIYSGVT